MLDFRTRSTNTTKAEPPDTEPAGLLNAGAALSTAYNGASVGGVLLSPLWVALIAAFGFAAAAALVGAAMVLALWWLSARFFAQTPSAMGLAPDGGAAPDGCHAVVPSAVPSSR